MVFYRCGHCEWGLCCRVGSYHPSGSSTSRPTHVLVINGMGTVGWDVYTYMCVCSWGGGGTHCVIEAFNRISMRDIKYLLLDISYWISPIGLSPIGNSLKAYILMKLKIVRIIIILTWEHKVQVQWSPIFDHPH